MLQKIFLLTAVVCLLRMMPGFCDDKKDSKAKPNSLRQCMLDELYKKYKPGFFGKPLSKRQADLSSEDTFMTKSYVDRSSRADALVVAGMDKEKKGEYRLALDIYQQVIDKFPDTLYRMSPYGLYVPVSHYCQLRILNFPKEHLRFYRDKNDSKAKELYEVSRKKNSLEGLAYIRDNLLCTTYGARAMLILGDAELDRGHYLAALEYFNTVKKYFPEKEVDTPELTLKIAYCRKMLGEKVTLKLPKNVKNSKLGTRKLQAFLKFVRDSKVKETEFFTQRFSPAHITLDDYAHMVPTNDPLALKKPVWSMDKSGGGMSVETQPVVTDKSVIYRHLNRIYCRSLLNGELRWVNKLGGRVSWQSYYRCRREDILVHDGMVFTPMYKNGPTLMALDEMTGQLKWSYGPMSASTEEESMMRFRTAPAAGPSTVYAGYVQDNIGSGVHIDSEYGVIAFESRTGRVKWRRPLCWIRPGKFASSFGGGVRLRIRSFSSPPIYHQGTVYYCTNAGSIAALDALSGRVKWLTKYPYYVKPNIHDATRGFGGHSNHVHPPAPMLWLNQPPLVVGDDLYVLPVNAPDMFKLDRRNGKILWKHHRREGVYGLSHSRSSGCGNGGSTKYFMGPVEKGNLLFVYGMRGRGNFKIGKKRDRRRDYPGGVFLVNSENGAPVWASKDPVAHHSKHPSLTYGMDFNIGRSRYWALDVNSFQFQITARPFLSTKSLLSIASTGHACWPIYGQFSNLATLDLKQREFKEPRRFYMSGEIIKCADNLITNAPKILANYEKQPKHVKKNPEVKRVVNALKKIVKDTVPQNEHPGFSPFARMTFKKYGTTFELRLDPGRISMLYNRKKVRAAVTAGKDPDSIFAASELAFSENRLEEAARLMESCLESISPEDVGFRYLVNQQLFRVYRRLARDSIRARNPENELKYVTGMSRSSTTLEDEIQTLFAVSDVYDHRKEPEKAYKYLKGIISKYGGYEYAVSSLYTAAEKKIRSGVDSVIKKAQGFVKGITNVDSLLDTSIGLAGHSLDLYYSAVSPARRDLNVRCEQVAVSKVLSMQSEYPAFKASFEKQAEKALKGRSVLEQLNRLIEFPGTRTGQQVVGSLLASTRKELASSEKDTAASAELRKRMWRLADIARLCNFSFPAEFKTGLLAPGEKATPALNMPLKEKELDMEEKRGPAWLALDRRGQLDVRPELLFLGARVKKKFDNKFLLYAVDTSTGKTVWKASEKRGETWFDEIRLKGKGNEAGFFNAFVYRDIVVVHGLFDALAFTLSDGKLKWRYRVPFGFEIRHSVMSGDLLALAGESETLMLYLGTDDPAGELAWQVKEQGGMYRPPYFYKDRLISVRQMPFSLTVRYRSTGKLIGRLDLDDLMLWDHHPLFNKGHQAYPMARDGKYLALCGSGYYHMLDVERMKVLWKRKMDVDSNTPVRMALDGEYLAIVKKDYDVEAIYMLNSRTGSVMWRTDPKDPKSPRPLYCMMIRKGKLYGLKKHPGQGFYFTGMDCKTGKDLFRRYEQKGYKSVPLVRLRPRFYGNMLMAEIKDRQDFELRAFDVTKGKPVHTVTVKGLGNMGEHGRTSCTVQNGCMVLHGKNTVKIAAP